MEQVECKQKMIEIRALTGLNRKDFCMIFDIPYRTMTEWERGTRKAPDYLMRLMEYYVRAQAMENDGIDWLGTPNILQRDGLAIDLLRKLSYKSELGINLKKNLHYFDKDTIKKELIQINEWYDNCVPLHELALDYRIKSAQSALLKYERYFPEYQARKVFNDLLGFRSLCDNYEEVLQLHNIPQLRIADLSKGKAADDGYRGVHVYYQLSGSHYPIEIQYNTYYDRQFNNWLHKYVYKKHYDNSIGCRLRELYENAKIQSEQDFKEELENVLFDSQTY